MKEISYDKKYYDRGSRDDIYGWIVNLFGWIELNNFRRNFTKNSLILEVGCGDGKISRWLSSKGFRVEAIDKSSSAIEIAKIPISKANYICGDVFSLKRSDHYYDAVFSLHVIEHVEKVENNLKEICRILKKEGKLIIRIPNSDSLEARLAGKDWFHWDEPYHLHHWTADEAVEMLKKAGFKKVKADFGLLEFKQVLFYSILSYLGIEKLSYKQKLLLTPFQLIFVPLSLILGAIFKNSGTIELTAEKT